MVVQNKMKFMNQKGFAHVLLLIILLIGVGIGVYLALNPTIFRPKASQGDHLAQNKKNFDPRLSVAHYAGRYPILKEKMLVEGAKDARDLGFQTIELYMGP